MWIAAPVLIVFIVAGLWWALFSDVDPFGKVPPPTPTTRVIAPAPTKTATVAPTLGLMVPTPTIVLLPSLPALAPAGTVVPTLAATAAPTTLAIGTRVVVADTGASGLNVRDGAGTARARLMTLADGAVLEIVAGPKDADGYTWYQVRDASGTTGWAVGTYMKPQQ
jgi:hypothetical protein